MSDLEPAHTEEKNSRAWKFIVPGIVVIAALIVVAFLASQSGLDKALLRQNIDQFSQEVSEGAAREGRDIKLTYRDIDITGSFSNRHAVILDPVLTVKPLETPARKLTPKDTLIVTTSEVAIYPRAVDLSSMRLRLEKPIEFIGGEDINKKLLTVTAERPFDIEVDETDINKREYLEITHALPQEINLSYLREQQAEGKEDATPTVVPVYESISVTTQPGATIRTAMAKDGSGLGEADTKIENLVITPEKAPEGAIKIAQLISQWKHTLDEKNRHVITASAHIGDITAAPEEIPYAPIALDAEASYEGASPQNAADVAASTAQETSFKLGKFSLTTKDARLNATADFVAGSGDVLPVGTANVTLTNVPVVLAELRKYGIVNPNNDPMITDILQLITGQPMAEITDAAVDVTRVRGGSFTIGKTTFEELFAAVLRGAMTRSLNREPAPAAEPTTPAAPVEKIQVEEGARG